MCWKLDCISPCFQIVYKLTGKLSEVEKVKTTLLNIGAHACYNAVLIIGTHRDKVDSKFPV